MATYYLSDVHLRIDRPVRGERLARLVSKLDGNDHIVVVGDLCDFWCSARQMPLKVADCAGLQALANFRSNGGKLTIQSGNHDRWLDGYFQDKLGAEVPLDPVELEIDGLRVHSVHGHLLGGRAAWKGVMESKMFLLGFRFLPHFAANRLEHTLDSVNEQKRRLSDARHLLAYRTYADKMASPPDVVVLGHIHLTLDDTSTRPRLVVLGGWHFQSSYLRVAGGVATHVIKTDSD